MKGEERVMDVQGVRKSDMGCSVIGHARAFLYSDNNKTVIGTGFAIQLSER